MLNLKETDDLLELGEDLININSDADRDDWKTPMKTFYCEFCGTYRSIEPKCNKCEEN